MAPCATDVEACHESNIVIASNSNSTTFNSSKSSTINASVLHGPRDIRLESRTISPPGPQDLQVHISVTGICGSDLSYYKKFANGDICACSPLALGHESAGIVVGIGSCVKGFSLGDRVALEVGVPCGDCGICRKGRYNLCKGMRFRSSGKTVPHYQGTLQERINHPARWCYKIPSHITLTTAALLEPLSVAIHSVNRAALLPGHTALVIGAGTVGLLTAAMCLQSGCSAVTIADISAPRVGFATENGFATHGFVVPRTDSAAASASTSGTSTPSSTSSAASSVVSSVIMTPLSRYAEVQAGLQASKELAADMLALTQPPGSYDEDCDPGFDVVFECTGAESCMQTSLYAARPGGRVVMVGMGTPIQTLPLSAAHLREVDIVGIFRYANTYPQALAMVASGKLKGLDGLVTHRVRGLERVGDAMETAARGIGEDGELVLKVVIET